MKKNSIRSLGMVNKKKLDKLEKIIRKIHTDTKLYDDAEPTIYIMHCQHKGKAYMHDIVFGNTHFGKHKLVYTEPEGDRVLLAKYKSRKHLLHGKYKQVTKGEPVYLKYIDTNWRERTPPKKDEEI